MVSELFLFNRRARVKFLLIDLENDSDKLKFIL